MLDGNIFLMNLLFIYVDTFWSQQAMQRREDTKNVTDFQLLLGFAYTTHIEMANRRAMGITRISVIFAKVLRFVQPHQFCICILSLFA
jgi:hypothetical protein